jgi:choice-of-anchor C domain-containing protein
MKSIKPLLFGAACAAACAWGATANAAAFTNGSFEMGVDTGGNFITLSSGDTTSITGWTVGGAGVDYIGGYWQAQDGSRSLDLSALDAGSVSQTFDTSVGQSYLVDFWLAGNTAGGSTVKSETTSATGAADQISTFDISGHSTGSMGWTEYNYTFTATSASTTLTFASDEQNAYGPALDDVSVTATGGVPEPTAWALMLVGFGGLGAMIRRSRRSGAVTA